MSLLEAFPAPPSHIPSAHNPPPSRPPSFPLPPLPARPSHVSLPGARRDSTASSSSSRSWSSRSRHHHHHRPPELLTRLAISPTPLLDDDYDVTTSIPRHRLNDSISAIDIRDLPAADDDELLHTSIPPFNAFRPLHDNALADPIDPRNIPFYNLPPSPTNYGDPPPSPSVALASSPLSVSPQEIHFGIRAARSKSSTHRNALRARSRSKSTPRSPAPVDHPPLLPASAPLPPLPTRKGSLPPSAFKQPESERSASPDIDSIISSTPRPLRRQPSSFSDLAGSSAGIISRKSSLASAVSARSRKSSVVSATSRSGASQSIACATTLTLDEISNVVARETATWEREVNAIESDEAVEEDSDSSLDLHTPLPHLMVKHGLLSPHSKLLPQSEDRPVGESRPESILSTTTKSAVMKDQRNTPMRKERHRDGRLLRGGLGLTTGLGWSDSEDEDAPSPFTRRLSSLTLSRQSSTASIRSTSSYFAQRAASARHPLSKSYSGHGGAASFDKDEGSDATDEWGQNRPRIKGTARRVIPPPTSWHGRTGAGRSASSASFSSIKVKTTKSSPSLDSESGTIPSTRRSHNNSDETIQTPSSASSSLSMAFPSTPQDDVLLHGPAMTRKGGKISYDKDKHLPPLPIQPILKKQPSQIGMVGREGVPLPMTPARSRAGSIHMNSTPTTPKPTGMTKPTSVRPLHLPQRIASVGDRPAVPVPPLHHAASSTSLRSRQGVSSVPTLTPAKSVPRLSAPSISRMSSLSTSSAGSGGVGSASSSPVSTSNGLSRPKPRTGTGMTYRKSSSSQMGGGEHQRTGKALLVSSGIPQAPALNGLGIHTRSKTPVIPKASTTVVGQAF